MTGQGSLHVVALHVVALVAEEATVRHLDALLRLPDPDQVLAGLVVLSKFEHVGAVDPTEEGVEMSWRHLDGDQKVNLTSPRGCS